MKSQASTMASSVFSDTLQSITKAKLTELSKKRDIFERSKSSIFSESSSEKDIKKRLGVIFTGVKKAFSIKTASRKKGGRHNGSGKIISGSGHPQLEILLKNLERFMAQSQYDPSVSPKLLSSWEKSLMKPLDVQSDKYKYATLYGELVTEWLNAEKTDGAPDDSSIMSEGFEKVESAERQESRANWEKLVFEPLETDHMAISEYLRNLFGEGSENKQALKALSELRKSVGMFEESLSTPKQFNEDVLRWTINGLLASGLLSEEKCAVLKDFLASSVILAEVADVLNLRIQDISTWSWEDGVSIEQRKHVTGTYHVYFDEELLQAIFLQFIGIKWAVFFKKAFTSFSTFEGAWTSLRTPLSQGDKEKREYYLGAQQKKPSVQSKRQGIYKSIFFMSQLPDNYDQQSSSIQGEEEANYESHPRKRARQTARPPQALQQRMQQQQILQARLAQQQQDSVAQPQMYRMMAQQPPMVAQHNSYNPRPPPPVMPYASQGPPVIHYSNEEYDPEPTDTIPKSPMATKQFLLHLLSTELLVNTRLHGEFTCARSEFDSWSPSLPHSTISSVLSFFGLSQKWLSFFHTFLRAPLKFTSDAPSTPARPRQRGVPGAHALSLVCGETILFCLDYAVNQLASGTPLYRMHDDFWVWSSKHETVVKAWSAITTFTEIMGVSLNAAKTGTVRILNQKEPVTINPSFFSVTSSSAEAQKILEDTQTLASIDPSLPVGDIRWGFLLLSPITGKFIIDQEMVSQHISTLKSQLSSKTSILAWIQVWNTYLGTFFRSNFGKSANVFGMQHVESMLATMARIQKEIFGDGDVLGYLRGEILTRFAVEDVPDGYFYFPTELGGLELVNPFVSLTQIRDGVFKDVEGVMDDFFEKEREEYEGSKRRFENTQRRQNNTNQYSYYPPAGETFLSFEEWKLGRKEFSSYYEGNLFSAFNELLERPREKNVDLSDEESNELDEEGVLGDGYKEWVLRLYGQEMREKFGGLRIVDRGLLPMGMVGLFRSGRVRWQG